VIVLEETLHALSRRDESMKLPDFLLPDNVEDGCLGHSQGELVWNVTYACNLKCSHCYLASTRSPSPDELTTEEGLSLIDEVRRIFGSSAQVVFSGGEPLLREDLYGLIEYAHSLGLRVALASNGMLIDEDVARKLKKAGLSELAISIDGDERLHDAIRGVRGSFKAALEAAVNAKKVNLSFQLHFTLTGINEHLLPWIIELAERLGARRIFIFDLIPTGRGVGLKRPSLNVLELFNYILSRQLQSQVWLKPQCYPYYWVYLIRNADQLGLDKDQLRSYFKGCLAGRSIVRVTPKGEVTPCPFIPLSVGNVRRERLRHIWFNDQIMAKLRSRNLKGVCASCAWREVCGGCRAKALAYHGDLFAHDPLCPFPQP